MYLMFFTSFFFEFTIFNFSEVNILNEFNNLTNSSIYLFDILNFNFLLQDKNQKESILARSENILFLLIPLLYLYVSNMVKLSQFLNNGFISDSFSVIENRFIWGSIIAISINIIVHDIFIN